RERRPGGGRHADCAARRPAADRRTGPAKLGPHRFRLSKKKRPAGAFPPSKPPAGPPPPPRPGCAPGGLRVKLLPHPPHAQEERHGALRWRDARGSCPSLPDGTSPAAGCPAAAAVAAWNDPVAMPDRHSEGRGSTFFPVSIRVALAGVMGGSQELDK